MFFYAQKAVLYPEDPLYCQETKEVTKEAVNTRVFSAGLITFIDIGNLPFGLVFQLRFLVFPNDPLVFLELYG